jgi:hypothetical protein
MPWDAVRPSPAASIPRAAGDAQHIVARFLGQTSASGEPVAQPRRSAIVSRRRQAEIAELIHQFAQEIGGGGQGLQRVERIVEVAQLGRARHELRNALRARAAHRFVAEAAFLPDEARKQRRRQIEFLCDFLKHFADFIERQRLAHASFAIQRGIERRHRELLASEYRQRHDLAERIEALALRNGADQPVNRLLAHRGRGRRGGRRV